RLIRELVQLRLVVQRQSSLRDNETCLSTEPVAHLRQFAWRCSLFQQTSYWQSVQRCSRCRETRERKSPSTQSRDAGRATRPRALLMPATADRDLPQIFRTTPSEIPNLRRHCNSQGSR